ncbi:MAG: UDP-N-acetylmuramoyl-L-alanine--D-glutamate ligase, partial [Opitutae bacterium]
YQVLDFIFALRTDWTGYAQAKVMKTNLYRDLLTADDGPVAILGEGMSGRAAQKLLTAKGRVTDLFDESNRIFSPSDAQRYSYIVQSPGFRPDHAWVRMATDLGKPVVSEIDLGVSYSDHLEIVAITGTNGKTSLTSILGHIANRMNMASIELGNIGVPISDAVASRSVEKKIIFHETSSFQSVTSRSFQPDAVLWTNFSTDHLDYHLSEREYFMAKLKLANDCARPEHVLIGSSVETNARKFGVELNPQFQIIEALTNKDIPEEIALFHKSIPQLENLAFAMCWAEKRGITKAEFFQALEGYQPHPHRLQKVTEINGVCFWNDSKSTNLASALAACKTFPTKVIWIGGGKSKGQEIGEFCSSLDPYLHSAFLVGETAEEVAGMLTQRGIRAENCENLKSAIDQAYESAKGCTDILFSPGFASFDMYSNYTERGNSFESFVFDLKSACQVITKIPVNNLQASH